MFSYLMMWVMVGIPTLTVESNGDGIGNNADTDDDRNGVDNQNDAFPLDSDEQLDTDSDGIGNNQDLDDDGDSFSDAEELAEGTDPLDANDYPDLGGLNIILIEAAIDARQSR
jgi:hypothetical protein